MSDGVITQLHISDTNPNEGLFSVQDMFDWDQPFLVGWFSRFLQWKNRFDRLIWFVSFFNRPQTRFKRLKKHLFDDVS